MKIINLVTELGLYNRSTNVPFGKIIILTKKNKKNETRIVFRIPNGKLRNNIEHNELIIRIKSVQDGILKKYIYFFFRERERESKR